MVLADREFLVTFGATGELGRFRAGDGGDYRHGARVVVRGQRGLEIGVVQCEASPRHARLVESSHVGELLRGASAEDERIAEKVRERCERLFDDGRRLASELNLPLEILDVEITLDGNRVTLYYVSWQPCDQRPLVSALSKKYEVLVAARDLALPAGAAGCDLPNCSQKTGAGCTTCTTGGCASGCGSPAKARELRDYFAGLRKQMEQRQRLPLL